MVSGPENMILVMELLLGFWGETMKTLKIVENDLIFDHRKNLVMVDGQEEEKQSVERVLSTGAGEWFLNIEHGLDYSQIRGKQVSDEQIRLAIMQALSQEERIAEVEDIQIRRDERARTVEIVFRCRMRSGQTIEGSEVLNIG